MKYPTAVHRADEEHDTPERTLSVAPAGFGVRWGSHVAAAAVGAHTAITQTSAQQATSDSRHLMGIPGITLALATLHTRAARLTRGPFSWQADRVRDGTSTHIN